MSLTLNIENCGKVTVQWKKSCGDFSYPPKGLGIDVVVPQKIAGNLLAPLKNPDSFAEENSKFRFSGHFSQFLRANKTNKIG